MGIVGVPQRNTTRIAHTLGCGWRPSDADFAVTATAGSAIDGPRPPNWCCPNHRGPRIHAQGGAAILKQKIAAFHITGDDSCMPVTRCRNRLGADCTKRGAVGRVASASRRKRGRCRATALSAGDIVPNSQRQVQLAARSVPPEDAGKARASSHDGRSQESRSDECDGSRRGGCGAESVE
jgi:hypothetical protein